MEAIDSTKPIPQVQDIYLTWPGKSQGQPKPKIIWLEPKGDPAMMKHEFEKLVNEAPMPPNGSKPEITDAMYKTIELVYMYHPAIEDKGDIVKLFLWFGMTVIEDMIQRSEDMRHLENQIRVAENNLQLLREEKRAKSKR